MTDTDSTYCEECKRPNRASATRCLWCGLPLLKESAPHSFEPTTVELDYLSGIERFGDSLTVQLVVSASGVEVTELMPGSRKITIPVESIIDIETAETEIEPKADQRQSSWWQRALAGRKKGAKKTARDCMLKITYKDGDEVVAAVFHREGESGASSVNRVARVIGLLIRRRDGRNLQA